MQKVIIRLHLDDILMLKEKTLSQVEILRLMQKDMAVMLMVHMAVMLKDIALMLTDGLSC